VNYPGNNNQPVHPTCLCATGTTNCSGTCKTTGTYTTNDGDCTGTCNTAYVQRRNQCGLVTNAKYSSYTNTTCSDGCAPTYGNCSECIKMTNSTYPYASIWENGYWCVTATERCTFDGTLTYIIYGWDIYNGGYIAPSSCNQYADCATQDCAGGNSYCRNCN
jgi:hypothetical protein